MLPKVHNRRTSGKKSCTTRKRLLDSQDRHKVGVPADFLSRNQVADRHRLDMRWKGDTHVDVKLPFGVRSAAKIFNAVADALEWCIASEGVEVIFYYLDDFAVLGTPDSTQCSQTLGILKTVCRELGVPLAPEKQAGPTTVIEFLGIIIDTSQQELRLPADKLEQLQHLTMEWKLRIHKQLIEKKRPSCTRQELESLLGIMHHACTAIPTGKAFV